MVPLNILDRYIARQFLVNTLVLLVILCCFVVAIDVSLNIDRFITVAEDMARAENAEPTGLRTGLITVFLVSDFWWPKLLQLYNYLIGIVLVGAMGFTCAQLVRHRELVAVLASGQSLHRVARPVLLVALGFTVVQAVNQELAMPRVAPLVTRDHGDAGRRLLGSTELPLTRDGLGRYWFASTFDADRGVLEDLSVWERNERGLATRRITAETARWRDGGWDLTGGMSDPRLTPSGAAAVPTPVTRIETDLDPTAIRMRRYAGFSQALSWAQIGQMIAISRQIDPSSPQGRAEREALQRIRFGRLSVMASNVLALVVTLPFFLTRVPRNMALQSLKCAPVAIVALMGGVVGASLPVPGVPAAISAFLPVMILLPVAIAQASAVKT